MKLINSDCIEAMKAMPRFRGWLMKMNTAFGGEIRDYARRSPQFSHYYNKLSRVEVSSLVLASQFASGGFGDFGGKKKKKEKAGPSPALPPWPYANLGLPGDKDCDAFTTELPFAEYLVRGGDGKEDY